MRPGLVYIVRKQRTREVVEEVVEVTVASGTFILTVVEARKLGALLSEWYAPQVDPVTGEVL